MMEPGKTAGEIALQEAWEEAGLTGVLVPEPIGSYVYEKFNRQHHVTVFLMRVAEVADDWPEKAFRQRCWLKPAQAVRRIEENTLREILESTLAAPQPV
jgi:8-oxo-dGTP pyrophosphatase MutT (NUDIX family)